MITQKERTLLKNLANKYMEIASLPVQNEKMRLWKGFNSLQNTRPMVVIDQLPWHELNFDGSLTLEINDPYFRGIEWNLKEALFKWKHFPADMVIEPFIKIPFCVHNSGYGLEASAAAIFTDANSDIGSWAYKNMLENEEDISKIKDLSLIFDDKASAEKLAEALDIFDGIAPVTQSGGVELRLQIWDSLAEYMGVENVYFDLMDRSEFIHRILRRITDSVLCGIKQLNALEIADDIKNTEHCAYIYTDELLPEFGGGKGKNTKNCWGSAMAQLFSSSSPATTAEFEVPYISEIADNYGMFYYGCCERLDDRLDIIQKIPNLKKISCSPWSDMENFIDKIDKKYIISCKPNPAFIAGDSVDEDVIKEEIKKACDFAKRAGKSIEFILKDVSTVKYKPERLNEWAKIAMEIVNSW